MSTTTTNSAPLTVELQMSKYEKPLTPAESNYNKLKYKQAVKKNIKKRIFGLYGIFILICSITAIIIIGSLVVSYDAKENNSIYTWMPTFLILGLALQLVVLLVGDSFHEANQWKTKTNVSINYDVLREDLSNAPGKLSEASKLEKDVIDFLFSRKYENNIYSHTIENHLKDYIETTTFDVTQNNEHRTLTFILKETTTTNITSY